MAYRLFYRVGGPGFEPGTFGSQNCLEGMGRQKVSALCLAHMRRIQQNGAWNATAARLALSLPYRFVGIEVVML
jgi:hypothetical protein